METRGLESYGAACGFVLYSWRTLRFQVMRLAQHFVTFSVQLIVTCAVLLKIHFLIGLKALLQQMFDDDTERKDGGGENNATSSKCCCCRSSIIIDFKNVFELVKIFILPCQKGISSRTVT